MLFTFQKYASYEILLKCQIFFCCWLTLEHYQEFSIYIFSHFENGHDVTVYFVLYTTEMCVLLSVRRRIQAGLQKGPDEMMARM